MAITWADMYSLSLLSAAVAAITMGLAYAIGHFLENPRFTVWAKTEIFQVAASVVMVFTVLFLVGLIGLDTSSSFSMNAGWIAAYAPAANLTSTVAPKYGYPQILESDNVFNVSQKYLQNMAYFSHRAVRASRAMMGAMDEFSKYTRTPCVPPWLMCLMGVNGVNVRPLAGGATMMQMSNMLLYSSTVSYLTVLAQIFLLNFIQSGLAIVYLPLAIVLRSLPFMRELGGALLAICFSLFIVYPMLLYVESAFWDPYQWIQSDNTWGRMADFTNSVESTEGAIGYGDMFFGGVSGADWYFHKSSPGIYEKDAKIIFDDYTNPLIRINSASFLSAVFMFTFNMLAITAAASMFARLLGAEVDLSRLMQIV